MSDIVERLRGPCVDYDKTEMPDGAEPLSMDCGTLREAANEIERLYSLAKANNALARRHADTITALRAEVERLREAGIDLAAHLAAAISLLEHGGKAAKKAAPSDKMFDQMIRDYKRSLDKARAILAQQGGEVG